jgi:hypothetical protein
MIWILRMLGSCNKAGLPNHHGLLRYRHPQQNAAAPAYTIPTRRALALSLLGRPPMRTPCFKGWHRRVFAYVGPAEVAVHKQTHEGHALGGGKVAEGFAHRQPEPPAASAASVMLAAAQHWKAWQGESMQGRPHPLAFKPSEISHQYRMHSAPDLH